MREIAWRWLPIVTVATLLLPAAAATVGEAPTAEPSDARTWLARIHAAANQRNYQGTLVFSAGGALSSSRVAHFCVGEQSFERLETLDGRQQRIYRQNDQLHTVWPQARVVVQERAGALSSLPSSTQVVEPRALERYELKAEGSERVAGREAQVFLLQPRDEMRYAQRLWADKATGLMLRADVIGPSRQVLESTAFSEVEIGVKPQPETVLQPMKKLDGYRVVKPQQQRTQLESEGWALDRPVAGFAFAGCMKRTIEAPPDATGNDPVLQVVYSDGVTHVSLFIEPYDARRAMVPLTGQLGATGTLRQRRGEHWITVMGDVPAATLRAFADALERRR
jgi:sigma-E factor negative regulatory protein RseB